MSGYQVAGAVHAELLGDDAPGNTGAGADDDDVSVDTGDVEIAVEDGSLAGRRGEMGGWRGGGCEYELGGVRAGREETSGVWMPQMGMTTG
ncbi:hypothetical protein MMC27_007537 [Xylographa pallens]|nr:hypothetical protein [Xylographa pallens]